MECVKVILFLASISNFLRSFLQLPQVFVARFLVLSLENLQVRVPHLRTLFSFSFKFSFRFIVVTWVYRDIKETNDGKIQAVK